MKPFCAGSLSLEVLFWFPEADLNQKIIWYFGLLLLRVAA